MLLSHEIVARNSVLSSMLACSILEEVGRMLKGRDLTQVWNAVRQQTEIECDGRWFYGATYIIGLTIHHYIFTLRLDGA